MKAVKFHGGGAALERTSCNVGLRGMYGAEGIETLSGLEGRNCLEDMTPSSSASQSDRTEEQGEVSLYVVVKVRVGFFVFDFRIAVRM